MQKYPDVKLTPKKIEPWELRIWTNYSRELYRAGILDENEYQVILHAQMPADSLGRLWTIGAESGNWYRLDDGEWIQDIPPMNLYMMVPEETLQRIEAQDKRKFEEAMAKVRLKPELATRNITSPPTPSPVQKPATVPPASQMQATGTVSPQVENTVNCQKCGAENPPEGNFCVKCGSPIKVIEVEKKFCSKCGTKASPDAVFCLKCGNKLS